MGQGSLATKFGLLGAFVGKFPRSSAFFCLLFFVPSFIAFYLKLRLEIGLDEGFVAADAPSRREISVQKAFFGETDQSKEWYLALFGIAKSPAEDGNMLRSDHYDEFSTFYEHITKRMVVQGPRGNFTYAKLCQPPLCEINEQLQKLMDNAWLQMLGQVQMRYPVSRVFSYDVNIGKHVFNRSTDMDGNLIGSRFMAFFFTTFIREPAREQELALFEKALVREAERHNAKEGSQVELVVHGSNTVAWEMQRGVMDAAKNKLIGLVLCLLAFLCLHFCFGWIYAQFPLRRLLLALLSLLLPFLSLLGSLGFISIFGLPVNLVFFTSPTLLLSILSTALGTFQLTSTWNRLQSESCRKQFSASERLASTFEQICAPFLCSHLTPVLSFAVLFLLLGTDHYRAWALAMSLLHAHSLLLQVFLFSPLLSLLCHPNNDHLRFENGNSAMLEISSPNDPSPKMKPSISDRPPIVMLSSKNGNMLITAMNGHMKEAKKVEQSRMARRKMRVSSARILINPLCSFLASSSGKCLVLLLSLLFCWLSLSKGLPTLANNMDYRRMLPRDSPARRGFDLMDTIWMDFLQILYIVRRPPDFEDPAQFAKFKEFLSATTSLPQALPPRAHQSWLFDYFRDQLDSDLFQHLADPVLDSVNMTKFEQFINGFPYRAWQSGVHYTLDKDSGSSPSIDEMLVMVAYNGTRGLAGKRSLISQCRAVAKRYPEFLVSVFDTDSRTADIMDAVDPLVWSWLIAFVVMSLVVSMCVFYNPSCSLLYTFSTISTLINLFGLGQLLGLQLDLLTVPTVILISSLSVQLGGLFVGQFLACWAKEDRTRQALICSLAPLTSSVLLLLLASLPPLLFSQVPFFGLQARLCVLGIVLALWHCAFLVPCLASFIPHRWIS